MPIRRELRGFYPIDWVELSRAIRFGRAKGRCEQCRRPHGKVISHLGDGRWFDADDDVWRDGEGREIVWIGFSEFKDQLKRTHVILATAHRNHDPTDNRASNLKALCQRCHMLHDQGEHLRQRRLTYRRRLAMGDLFDGPYGRW